MGKVGSSSAREGRKEGEVIWDLGRVQWVWLAVTASWGLSWQSFCMDADMDCMLRTRRGADRLIACLNSRDNASLWAQNCWSLSLVAASRSKRQMDKGEQSFDL